MESEFITPSTKRCPYCAEEIQAAAVVCRFCGRELEPTAAAEVTPASVPAKGSLATKIVIGVIGAAVIASWLITPARPVSEVGQRGAASAATPSLVVTASRFYNSDGYHYIEGQVKNVGATAIDNLQAVGTFTDAGGAFVKSDTSLVEFRPLLPGQVTPFKVMTSRNQAVARASLQFKQLMGGLIEHIDYSRSGQ